MRARTCANWRPEHPWRFALKIVIAAALITAILVASLVFHVHKRIPGWLEWIDNHKAEGGPIFAAVYAVCVVLLVPAALLSLGAGAAFGLWIGVLVVWCGAVLGQSVAFVISRFLLRRWVERALLSRFPRWKVVDKALEKDAWKIVGLLRLAPLLPYSALNYVLGLTPIPAWHYMLVSAFAIIPGSFLYVYIGSLIGDITKVVSEGNDAVRPEVFAATAAVTGVVIIAVIVLVTYYAKRALRVRLEEAEQESRAEELELSEGEETLPNAPPSAADAAASRQVGASP